MGEALEAGVRRLRAAGVPMARGETERLLAWLLGTDRGGVVVRRPDAIPGDLARRFGALVSRRVRREPFQYLTGEEEFLDLRLRVDRRVLVPRPETECLVEAVLSLPVGARATVVDVGTGSGCIAVALACRRPDWSVVAVDRSAGALEVAGENAARHGCRDRIRFLEDDLSRLPATSWRGAVEVVVSNPPYVSEAEWAGLEPEVRDHEPKEALVAGPTGLEAYEKLAPAAARLLVPGGFLAIELGYRSERGARDAVESAGLDTVDVLPDMRGIPRVLIARARGETEGPE